MSALGGGGGRTQGSGLVALDALEAVDAIAPVDTLEALDALKKRTHSRR